METSVEYMDSLKEEMKNKALNNVLTQFPNKCIELDALLKDDHKFKNGFDVSVELNIPVPQGKEGQTSDAISESCEENTEENAVRTSNVVVRSNRYLVEMVTVLKPQLIEFIGYTLELSAAINLLMPPIEDGNNFGVEVQQECYDATINAENDVYHRLQEIYKYFSVRADLVTKAVKNPKCEDFSLAVQERDRLCHKYLVISLRAVRNHYMNLHDLVFKNISKIKRPKSRVSTEFLY